MTRTLLIIAIFSLSVTSAFSGEALHVSLTTNILEQTSVRLDKAGNAQDSDTLLTYLASNAVITVSFPENPEIKRIVFSKETYATHLAHIRSRTRDVSIRRLTTEFKIAADGQSATATSMFRQTATDKDTGQTFASTGKQVSEIRLIDGVPKATKIDATLTYE